MKKLIIEVEKNLDLIEELKGIPKLLYKSEQYIVYNLFFKLLPKLKFEKEVNKNHSILSETGDEDFIKYEKEELEKFMFSDEKELKRNKKYREISNKFKERGKAQILSKIKIIPNKIKEKIKDATMKVALGGNNLITYFIKFGIFITWRIEDVKE